MTVTTPVVESQLKLIQERGYHVIPLQDAAGVVTTIPRSQCRSASVVLVADDGHRIGLHATSSR